MVRLIDHADHGGFFRKVERAAERVLFLSHDGTFPAGLGDRTGGDLSPVVLELLNRTMKYTRMIAISSGPAHEVATRIGSQLSLEIWGNDGLERLYPDGKYECKRFDVPQELLRALSNYESELDRQGWRDLVEVKLTGITVRWKGLSPADQLEICRKAHGILRKLTMGHPALAMMALKESFELRLPVPCRSVAVEQTLSLTGPDTAIAYVGHSVTDEDSFRVVNSGTASSWPRGLSVLISPMSRFTAAQLRLRAMEDFVQFLRNWATAVESRTSPQPGEPSYSRSIAYFPRDGIT